MSDRRGVFLLALLGALASLEAAAEELDAPWEERSFPQLRGEILVELRSDSDLDSTSGDHALNLESAFSLRLSEHLSIESGFVFEPVSDPLPGRDRWFEGGGLFAETLFLLWERGRFSLRAGKLDPAFGFAWELAPGSSGTQLTMTTQSEPGGFFKIATPLLSKSLKSQMESDLLTLKALLEAES